ncbi:MAG: AAA family ATPase [Solirubrobacteraceae bacterium]
MAAVPDRAGGGRLVERDRELAEVDRALGGALAADGWLHVIEGPAGIGKTALLDEARRRAAQAGVAVLAARGGELEGEFPYGVVRQLFESVVRTARPARRRRLLAGAAGFAAPAVLGPEAETAAPADPAFTVAHGLYWLAANLGSEAPLALVVDDVHWSDAPSLRFLLHLARRLSGLPVTLIVSIRSGEPGSDPGLVGELAGSPGARVSVPAALSEAAVASLLAAAFGQPADVGFVRACARATGGNPFLLRELAAALSADGIEPTADAVAGLEATGPRTIARATLGRLGHLSDHAVALARAIAVLGGDAQLPRAARLAGLEERQGLAALDALVAADVIPASGRLEFNHPVVRAAIYDELASGERSAAHRQIAALLAAEGAELDAVAGHLLLTHPTGSAETISTLREAAAHALALGAPDGAATYLARALQEGCERDLRTTLLMELALAEKLATQPSTIGHLEEVRRIAADPLTRARATIELAELLVYSGDWERPLALFETALGELGDGDPALARRTDVLRTLMTAYDPRLVAGFEQRMPALFELAERGGTEARGLAMTLAGVAASRGLDRRRACSLVERGWDEGRLLVEGTNDATISQGLYALLICDELDRATELVDAVADMARTRGSLYEFLMDCAYRGGIENQRGDLAAAEALLRAGCERALEFGVLFGIPSMLFFAADVLLERPDAADIATLAETIELGAMADVLSGAFVFQVRGRLRFAAGDRTAAIADMRRAGSIHAALGSVNPNLNAWRSTLALMLEPKDRQQALDLVMAELADARRVGQPRGIGVALHALGALEREDAGHANLKDAVAVLADSPARLEHARALVTLGAALRRHGDRTAARAPLRDGLDLATRCGATRLAARAHTELAATGARPRRAYSSGRDALTASELRVARMAAAGRTSQQIAEALFVATKTIDAHLQHSYAKLGINSRRQLAAALERDPEP